MPTKMCVVTEKRQIESVIAQFQFMLDPPDSTDGV
jgi:hypothetical protein